MKRLSKSTIETFIACPFSWKCQEDDQIERENEALIRGQVVHACIEAYAKHCVEKNLETDFNYIEHIIKQVLDKWRLSFDVYDESLELLNEFANSRMFVPSRVVAVEREMEMKISVPPYKYRGRIDLGEYEKETKTLIVTDYKTSKRVLTKKEVEKEISLAGYALLLIADLKLDVEHIIKRMDFVRYAHIIECECEVADLEKTRDRIVRMANLMTKAESEKNFPATPGYFCDWCNYPEHCPYASQIEAIKGIEDARKVGGDILVLEEQLKSKKAHLKSYCELAGDVDIHKVKFGFLPSDTKIWDKKKTVDFLIDRGLDISIYMNPNGLELKKFKDDLIETGAMEEGKKTSFRHSKIKEE